MSTRPVGVLVGDMLERIDRIARYTRGLDHDAFLLGGQDIVGALEIAERAYVFAEGPTVAEGVPSALRQEARIQEGYLGLRCSSVTA